VKTSLIRAALFLPLLACLLGASSISFDAGHPNPNPNGTPQVMDGAGDWVLDKTETLDDCINFAVNTKTKQISGIQAGLSHAKTGNTWNAQLSLTAANYDTYANLYTIDAQGNALQAKTKVENRNVK
jgi:hypothetical protein